MNNAFRLCLTQKDHPIPRVPSETRHCEDCGIEVWHAFQQFLFPALETRIICLPCWNKRIAGIMGSN